MTENLLQYIWQYRLYSTAHKLKTIDGEQIIVLHPGQLNTNAGPDFLEAKIKIDNTIWAGNVEIHLLSSDWNKHKHGDDENYDKLILHVVYVQDTPVTTFHNSRFPTLELKSYLQENVVEKYSQIMQSKDFIPCVYHLPNVRSITVEHQMQRMLAERLEEKVHHICELLKLFQNNWQEVFYIQLARSFGLHINQDAFEKLALHTPLSLFAKHKNNAVQIEALLFGQAGFLYDYFDEAYPSLLQQEYLHLKKLYHLEGLSKNMWKFLRLRPANFPTIRIAQFAQLLLHSTHLFSKIISASSIHEIELLFETEVSHYWLSHYTFSEKSVSRSKQIGKTFIQTAIINAVIPSLFAYGKLQGSQEICDRAVSFLQELPAEKNTIVSRWSSMQMPIKNAADSQAILQLYNKYCIGKKCLQCSIGYEIFKKTE